VEGCAYDISSIEAGLSLIVKYYVLHAIAITSASALLNTFKVVIEMSCSLEYYAKFLLYRRIHSVAQYKVN